MENPLHSETVKQTVILVFTLLTAAGMIIIERAGTDPDFGKTTKMKGADTLKRWCNKVALKALDCADSAEAFYERQRL